MRRRARRIAYDELPVQQHPGSQFGPGSCLIPVCQFLAVMTTAGLIASRSTLRRIRRRG